MTQQTSDESNQDLPGPVADEGEVGESGRGCLSLVGVPWAPATDTNIGFGCLVGLGVLIMMPIALFTGTEAPIFGPVCCEADDSLWVKILFGLVSIPLGLLAAAFALGLLVDNAQKKRSTNTDPKDGEPTAKAPSRIDDW